jgi:hypothetical protein
MPCNGDYMDPNSNEAQLSQVACLLDELAGKPFNRDHWQGYHPDVYGKGIINKKNQRHNGQSVMRNARRS